MYLERESDVQIVCLSSFFIRFTKIISKAVIYTLALYFRYCFFNCLYQVHMKMLEKSKQKRTKLATRTNKKLWLSRNVSECTVYVSFYE